MSAPDTPATASYRRLVESHAETRRHYILDLTQPTSCATCGGPPDAYQIQPSGRVDYCAAHIPQEWMR